jgi:hypothetical protein
VPNTCCLPPRQTLLIQKVVRAIPVPTLADHLRSSGDGAQKTAYRRDVRSHGFSLRLNLLREHLPVQQEAAGTCSSDPVFPLPCYCFNSLRLFPYDSFSPSNKACPPYASYHNLGSGHPTAKNDLRLEVTWASHRKCRDACRSPAPDISPRTFLSTPTNLWFARGQTCSLSSLGRGMASDQIPIVGDMIREQSSQPRDVIAPVAV